MLQLIRDRAQGIIVWTIVGLIIITFALFGLSSYLTGASDVNVASVNGNDINETELQRAYQNYQQRLQQMLGKSYDPNMFSEATLKAEVLQGLISRELTNQYLTDNSFHASGNQVLEYISNMPAFQENGKFSATRYKDVMRAQNMNSRVFERDVSRDIVSAQLREGLVNTAFVTPNESTTYARLQNQQRDIGYMQFESKTFAKNIKIDDAQIESFYADNGSMFMTTEQVSIDYLELDLNKLASKYTIADDEIKQYYEDNKGSYIKQPEQRKASHILIKVNKEVSDEVARKRAEDLLARLRAGESFAELAKQHSEDPGSAKQGGDLGFFGRGVMDAAFEAAAFKLKKDEISEPVKSSFGYHLIKLDDLHEVSYTAFKDVKASIKKDLQMQQAEKTFYDDTARLENLSFENPDSLQPVAEQLGMKVISSPLFGRSGGPGVLADPKVSAAVFSDEVLGQGRNSKLIEISDTHAIVLRIKEHKPSVQKPLTEVTKQIETRLKNNKAAELASQQAEEAKQKLLAGEKAEKVAKSYKLKWTASGYISRTPAKDLKLDQQIIKEAFSMAKPAGDKPNVKVLPQRGGNIVVLALYSVQDGKPETEEAKQKAQTVRLTTMDGNVAYTAFMENLKAQASISISQNTEQQ